jgi:hypothetical protein
VAQECGFGQTAFGGGNTYAFDFLDDSVDADQLVGADSTQFLSRSFPYDSDSDGVFDGVRNLSASGNVDELVANGSGMVELDPAGRGFTTHNRDDVFENGSPQPDQCGKPEHIAALMNTMGDYATKNPGSTISIGDVSTDTGDSPLLNTGSTARHQSHYDGSQVDMQYPLGTGSAAAPPVLDADKERTQGLMDSGRDWGMDRFFYSPDLAGDLTFDEDATTGTNNAHHNHIHMGDGPASAATWNP